MTQAGTLDIYWRIGIITVVISVIVLALSPIVRRWMHIDTLRDREELAGQAEPAEPEAAGYRTAEETR
jgi:proton-dependent oligopeptide transporter, POT family